MTRHLTPSVAAGDTVADLSERLALVLLVDRHRSRVILQWDDGEREVVDVADLLTDPGRCEHVLHHGSRYRDPEPPETCDEPTVPGETRCPDHGGKGWL